MYTHIKNIKKKPTMEKFTVLKGIYGPVVRVIVFKTNAPQSCEF